MAVTHYAQYTTPCWADPVAATERAERLAAWQATVDGAIARMRREEGFDGTRQPWTTLGECLLPERRDRRYHHAA